MGVMLYLDCSSGVSGDMVVAALLDAGASEERLRDVLASLPVDGFETRVSRRRAGAIDACDFDVVLDAAHDGHDHDMAYLYGSLDDAAAGQGDRASGREGHEARHQHEHRHLADVLALIDASSATAEAKGWAHRIFGILAQAEAKAHGVSPDKVHFHEVGAVDSIVDVLAAAVCLDNLGVDEGAVSALYEGRGRVRTQHGVLPVPVPAVVNIAAAHGLVLERGERTGEFVTPTGAAIAAAVSTRADLPARYTVQAVGYGVGKRAYDPPSVVRALLVHEAPEDARPDGPDGEASVWKLEADIDDATPETLGYALRHLMDAGAREAHALPVLMKEGRPATQVQVICDEAHRTELERILFLDTTTIGIRRARMERTVLPRRMAQVDTDFGLADVKVVTLPDGSERGYPEHRWVARTAQATGAGYQEVRDAVVRGAWLVSRDAPEGSRG